MVITFIVQLYFVWREFLTALLLVLCGIIKRDN